MSPYGSYHCQILTAEGSLSPSASPLTSCPLKCAVPSASTVFISGFATSWSSIVRRSTLSGGTLQNA
ncbi:hypothetical protein EVA_13456 [gut metagenome]|uniref:Uncharacterized protein n=1 Tax=gut metagenome TaxID=749906 RepID=J9GGF9_9ZZZZ